MKDQAQFSYPLQRIMDVALGAIIRLLSALLLARKEQKRIRAIEQYLEEQQDAQLVEAYEARREAGETRYKGWSQVKAEARQQKGDVEHA